MEFRIAERKNALLRMAMEGVSGGGKTLSALLFAFLLPDHGAVGVIDSEHGSASLYAGYPGVGQFQVLELESHTIPAYLDAISAAARAGIRTLLIDSYSHSWASAMEMIDRGGGWAKAGKNITPLINKLVAAITTYPGHVICTLRSKTDFAVEKDEKTGKITGMRKLGLGAVARPDTEYEFTLMLTLTREGTITVSKSRCGSALPIDQIYDRATDLPKIAGALSRWLAEGAPVSAVDTLADRIRFVDTMDALRAIGPELNAVKAIDVDGFRRLKGLYMARLEEFQGAESAGEI